MKVLGDQKVQVTLTPDTIVGSQLTTVNTYVALAVDTPTKLAGNVNVYIRGYKSLTDLLKAATNNVLFQVSVSHDATEWVVKETDVLVVVGTNEELTLEEHWNWMKIEIKPAVVDTHGTGTFQLEGGSL